MLSGFTEAQVGKLSRAGAGRIVSIPSGLGWSRLEFVRFPKSKKIRITKRKKK